MDALFASGRIIDLVLLGVAAEALLLLVLFRGARGIAGLGATLAAGAALMLALRAALTGAPWIGIAGWMLLGLLAHCVDLALRLRGLRRAGDAWPQPRPAQTRNIGFWGAFSRRSHLKRF